MKNRSIEHKDDWATPKDLYDLLDAEFEFDFDPCPFNHDVSEWDGLVADWGKRNFVNPPYSRTLKEAFVKRAISESGNGNLCVMLLPVSTSTKLFHDHILPNNTEIRFLRGRIPFIGINTKGEYVNWPKEWSCPDDAVHVRNSGMHDSMIVIFDGRK
jgi:hypothetical protein